jgi:hypothetical protein
VYLTLDSKSHSFYVYCSFLFSDLSCCSYFLFIPSCMSTCQKKPVSRTVKLSKWCQNRFSVIISTFWELSNIDDDELCLFSPNRLERAFKQPHSHFFPVQTFQPNLTFTGSYVNRDTYRLQHNLQIRTTFYIMCWQNFHTPMSTSSENSCFRVSVFLFPYLYEKDKHFWCRSGYSTIEQPT